jgi:hypothetical protein
LKSTGKDAPTAPTHLTLELAKTLLLKKKNLKKKKKKIEEKKSDLIMYIFSYDRLPFLGPNCSDSICE